MFRRIYEEFSAVGSALAIARVLNADGIPSPRGGAWSPSTIHGHRGRSVGIRHNPLYAGKQLLNQRAFPRDRNTGTRRARLKSPEEWVETAVPELAIVDEALWTSVQDRLASIPERALDRHRRPKRLFSGLIVCGECGGNITIAFRDRYGCAGTRQKGACSNNGTMAGPEIESRILDALCESLMAPGLVETFIEEYHAELQCLQKDVHRRTRAIAKQCAGRPFRKKESV